MFLVNYVLLSIISASAYANYSAKDLSEERAQEIVYCFGEIMCVAKEPLAFRKIELAANSPDLLKRAFGWLSEIYGVKAEQTDEWWNSTPDVICKLSRPERMEKFTEFGTEIANHYKENKCESEKTELCKAYQRCFAEGEEVVRIYTKEKEVCCDKEKPHSQACARSGAANVKSMGGMG